jgi:Fe-S-cluster containining protein
MKLEELESLASQMNMGNILIGPEDVILSMEGKGDLKSTFPIPNCDKCEEKCCPPRVAISLFDAARFMDKGLGKFVAGTFEGYVELFLSDDGGDVKLSRPYISSESSAEHSPTVAKDCVFLDEDRKCSIYEDRPLICRSYPVAIRIDEDKSRLALWLGGCQDHKISSDEAAFRKLLNSAIQDYNERLKSNALLMNSRNQLRELGFGEYMENEWQLLMDYNKKNKDMQTQMEDLQQVVERLRAPQDYTNIMQRLQNDNDWLKERVVNLESELTQQRGRAHSIISELTTQLSEQRKLLESLHSEHEERSKKGFWKR